MNSDGSNVIKLNDDGNLPSFSPDGKKIAFIERGWRGIYTMNADGTDTTLLIDCGNDMCIEPVWAPKGQ